MLRDDQRIRWALPCSTPSAPVLTVPLSGRRSASAPESFYGVVAHEQDVAVGQRPVATASARQVGAERVAGVRFRVIGRVDMRHDRTVQDTEAVIDRVEQFRYVVDSLKTAQVRCQDADAGAVSGVDDVVSLEQVEDDRVRSTVREGAPQHEDVPTAHPDNVRFRQLRGCFSPVTQIDFGHEEAEGRELGDFTLHAGLPDIVGCAVHRIGDQREATTVPGQFKQSSGMVTHPKRR